MGSTWRSNASVRIKCFLVSLLASSSQFGYKLLEVLPSSGSPAACQQSGSALPAGTRLELTAASPDTAFLLSSSTTTEPILIQIKHLFQWTALKRKGSGVLENFLPSFLYSCRESHGLCVASWVGINSLPPAATACTKPTACLQLKGCQHVHKHRCLPPTSLKYIKKTGVN